MENHILNGKDAINIFDFSNRFVTDFGMLKMYDEQKSTYLRTFGQIWTRTSSVPNWTELHAMLR